MLLGGITYVIIQLVLGISVVMIQFSIDFCHKCFVDSYRDNLKVIEPKNESHLKMKQELFC